MEGEIAMTPKSTLVSLVLSFAMLMVASPASATRGLRDSWKSAYPDVCQDLIVAADDCFLCHSDGSDLNAYGQDYADLGLSWIQMDQNNDSDRDGILNFQEITADCTLPGDDQSVPVDDATWSALKALFR